MWTESKRILIRDGHFGFALRQVAGGAEPLYLVTTTDGTATIRASGDFIRTDWDGVERRKAERRQAERRAGDDGDEAGGAAAVRSTTDARSGLSAAACAGRSAS